MYLIAMECKHCEEVIDQQYFSECPNCGVEPTEDTMDVIFCTHFNNGITRQEQCWEVMQNAIAPYRNKEPWRVMIMGPGNWSEDADFKHHFPQEPTEGELNQYVYDNFPKAKIRGAIVTYRTYIDGEMEDTNKTVKPL